MHRYKDRSERNSEPPWADGVVASSLIPSDRDMATARYDFVKISVNLRQ